jgi:FixJ family two-component response regulator
LDGACPLRKFATEPVLALVVTGRMNKQIAADLNVGEVTAKVHRGQKA